MSPESSGTLPAQGIDDEPKDSTPAQLPEHNASPRPGNSRGVPSESPLISRRSTLTSVPSSPSFLSTVGPKAPIPSPLYDLDLGTSGQERNSLLKALSGFWPQNLPHRIRFDDETDDPIRDPEHIFRDSAMVVRTDEPTSIIALALK
jgi:1-phosphatidylinositol-3-phosphate 5-kinase